MAEATETLGFHSALHVTVPHYPAAAKGFLRNEALAYSPGPTWHGVPCPSSPASSPGCAIHTQRFSSQRPHLPR